MTENDRSVCTKKCTDWWRKQASLLLAETHQEGLPVDWIIDGMLLAAVQLQADTRGLAGAASYLQSLSTQLIGWSDEAAHARSAPLSPPSEARH
jgi:hypothetical protein